MNKFDSEYSALKALAISVGAPIPDGGWDSSYSIIYSLYGHLVGSEPSDLSPIEMLTVLQEGTENGDIVWETSDCAVEIERLNNIIASLQEQLENCGSGGGSDCTEEIAELNTTIAELELQLQEASENADVALFGSIGYTKENANDFYAQLHSDLAYSRMIMESPIPSPFTYRNSYDLVYMPYIDIEHLHLSNANNMFENCGRLVSVPNLYVRDATEFKFMFMNCDALQYPPGLDTSSAVDMTSMFYRCYSLTNIINLSKWDVSNVTHMTSMFFDCRNLRDLSPLANWDVSNVTDMKDMFNGCKNLRDLSPLANWDTSNVTNIEQVFYACENITSIPNLNVSSVTNIKLVFGYSNMNNLTDLGGFTGLKIDWKGYGSLKQCPNLTVQSLLNVFNTIADVNELGGKTLEIGATNLAKLTDEEKAIATTKGWTLS